MRMILAIQIALFSLVIAREVPTADASRRSWFWRDCDSEESASIPCLVYGQSVGKRHDYTYTSGIGGHKVHLNAVTWPEARRACEEEGAHLAIINSVAEANAIAKLWKNAGETIDGTGWTQYASIGFHSLFQQGEYITLHDQTIAKAGYTQWEEGRPDNTDGIENCGSIEKNGGLNDIPCFTKTYAFICEVPSED